jgi:hypothetical protein
MEAIWRIDVEDFPAFIIIDDKGNDFFQELRLGRGGAVGARGRGEREALILPARQRI